MHQKVSFIPADDAEKTVRTCAYSQADVKHDSLFPGHKIITSAWYAGRLRFGSTRTNSRTIRRPAPFQVRIMEGDRWIRIGRVKSIITFSA